MAAEGRMKDGVLEHGGDTEKVAWETDVAPHETARCRAKLAPLCFPLGHSRAL